MLEETLVTFKTSDASVHSQPPGSHPIQSLPLPHLKSGHKSRPTKAHFKWNRPNYQRRKVEDQKVKIKQPNAV